MQAVNLLQDNGVAEGLGKLYSNLAASYLQMDKPYAAIAACNSALQVGTCHPCLSGKRVPATKETHIEVLGPVDEHFDYTPLPACWDPAAWHQQSAHP